MIRRLGWLIAIVGMAMVGVQIAIDQSTMEEIYRLFAVYPLYGWGAVLIVVGLIMIYIVSPRLGEERPSDEDLRD